MIHLLTTGYANTPGNLPETGKNLVLLGVVGATLTALGCIPKARDWAARRRTAA